MNIIHVKDLGMRMYAGRPRRYAIYLCPRCGKEFEHCKSNVERIKSCGCGVGERPLIHGDAKKTEKAGHAKLYRVFTGMRSRCYSSTNSRYKRYGGRGICVCNDWFVYENFKTWALDNGYADGLQIDRIDNDGNYCPENCRWVTLKENLKNRDLSAVGLWCKKLTPDMITEIKSGGSAKSLALKFGISESLVYKTRRRVA